ncbi:MAG: hypothetical protein ACD_59C00010G0001, partial [uncultured bacterium]
MLPATYDLASEIHATAKFSDGDSKSVDLIWALSSGSGNLSGSLYTPAPKPETAVFVGSYTENGITKTAQFRLKVIGLSSLTLSKTTDEVVSCSTYDLSQIIVSDKLSNNTINNVSNTTTWKLVSGFGTLSGTTYTSPARAETAAFTANYTEAGITKTVQFRLKVIALASIKLSKTTDEAQILAPYDLASNIAVTAKLSNGQTKPVSGNDPNLKWTLSYGSGILSGTLYTPPERIENAVLTATYKENGVAQSAQLRLKSTATLHKNVELVGLTLNKTTDSVALGQVYDLSKLIVIAKFADKTTAEVSLSWIISSGGGIITDNIFTAPTNLATVKLIGKYTADDNSVKFVNFTLSIINADHQSTFDSVTSIVGINGGSITLKNGIILDIPPHSLNRDSIINLSQRIDPTIAPGSQSVLNIDVPNDLTNGFIKIPVRQELNIECITVLAAIPLTQNFIELEGTLDYLSSYYIVPLNNIKQLADPNSNAAPNRLIYQDRLEYNLIIEKLDENQNFLSELNHRSDNRFAIDMPFYKQEGSDCWAATWLSFLKGYKANTDQNINYTLNNNYNTMYKLHHQLGVAVDGDNTGLPRQYLGPFWWHPWGMNIKTISSEILGYSVEDGVYYNKYTFACAVLKSISKGIPFFVRTHRHTYIFLGYNLSNIQSDSLSQALDKIKFIVHDPAGSDPYKEITFNDIDQSLDDYINYDSQKPKVYFDEYFVVYHLVETPALYINSIYNKSIHLPRYKDSSYADWISSPKGIAFKKSSDLIDKVDWDSSAAPDGYKLDKVELKDFTEIDLKQIPVFDAANISKNYKKMKARIYITSKNDVIYKDIDVPMKNLAYYCFSIDYSIPWSEFLIGPRPANSKFIKDRYIKQDDYDFTLFVELYEPITQNKLDGFDIKFKYRKATISSDSSGDLETGSSRAYTCMLGTENITEYVTWKCLKQNTDGSYLECAGLIDANGVFISTSPGTYIIVATANKPGTPEYMLGREAKFEINVVADLMLRTQKTKIGLQETTYLYAQYGEQYVDPVWPSLLCGVISTIPFDGTVYAAPKINAAPSRALQPPQNNYLYKGEKTGTETIVAKYPAVLGQPFLEATCAIEVMDTVITNDIKSSMHHNEVVPFTIKVEKVTESKEIELTSTGGEITIVSQELIPAAYCYILKGTFKLNDSDNESKYTISASLKNYSAIPKVDKEISVLPRDVKVMPSPVIVNCGQKQKFTAFVDNETQETNITWSVEGSGGGSIESSGLYTAPNVAGTYTVKALYYGKFEGTAEVTVQAPPFRLTPTPVTLTYGQTTQFAALVFNEPMTDNITWSVESTNGGSITTAGLYTAPNSENTYIVKAIYNNAFEATAEVIVRTPVLRLTPSAVILFYGQQQQFNALVDNATTETNITWSIDTSNGGTIAADGKYAAPNAVGTYVIKATYYDIEATAEVTVQAPVLQITPSTKTLYTNETQNFTLLVNNTTQEAEIQWTTTGG